ncbi:flavodoxin [Nocardioides albertanoniae]|uniref:Flavodoxin n=1 Tax=Nocardioides albertanoniae TaxID=1175486 RepID=A0A543A278_9ACTN|nr:flavodoxin family protein [Nocardioides albertanoniae]TQL66692.1 flavodoxin [Nocardioides albertanoniae]
MKTLIVCTSVSHGNTRRVAEAVGGVLNAPVVDPDSVAVDDLHDYDLVGFGSGIFNMAFHPRLRDLVASLPHSQGTTAFVFSSSGFPEPPFARYSRTMAKLLEQRGFDVVGSFSCRGHDTWWPFKPVGGLKKGRPNPADIDAARAFAKTLLAQR